MHIRFSFKKQDQEEFKISITMIDSQSASLPMSCMTCSSIRNQKFSMVWPRKRINRRPIKNLSVCSRIDHKVHARSQEIGDVFRGTLDKASNVFTKNYLITSYQLGFDSKASIRAIMNILQDTSVSQYRASWPAASSGFGVTEEMIRRDLFWVFYRTQIFIHSYPLWDDVIQVQSFLSLVRGKNTLLGEWLIHNPDTGELLIRASTEALLMNKKTRKFEKIPEKIREEMEPHHVGDHDPIIPEDIRIKFPPFDFNSPYKIQTGLVADWGDLDINTHVNNAKYSEWILKSIPESTFESKELSGLILNYKRECDIDSVVQSLTSLVDDQNNERSVLEMQHLLRFEDGSEVARARTTWRPKQNINGNCIPKHYRTSVC